MNDPRQTEPASTCRRRSVLAAVLVSTLLSAACGSDDDSGSGSPITISLNAGTFVVADGDDHDGATAATADSSPATGASNGADPAALPLDVDPCELLTIPEAEAAIGPGVVAGVAEDAPGRCTFAIQGGGGAVSITIGDPGLCDAVERSIEDGTAAATGLEVIDVVDGGIADVPTSTVTFLVGGGCISLNTGISGVRLDQADLIALAEAAAGHVS